LAGYPVLVYCWFRWFVSESPWVLAIHSVPQTSQQELTRSLPFPSCSLYNPKTSASWLPCLPPAFMLVSCLAYSLTLKMEVICSSKMSVYFQWTTLCYSPELFKHTHLSV
jgi:hypothetical protein